MKTFRYLMMVLALGIPVTAVAMSNDSAACCANGGQACCQNGCPLCHHAQ